MEIKGLYKGEVVARCCSKGKWHTIWTSRGSGSMNCKHTGFHTDFDYLDVSKLKEITNKKIIKEIEEYEEEQRKGPFIEF
jgi:hypothetical protein